MLRVIALSCLVLSVLGGQPGTSGGIQKFNVGRRVAGDKVIFAGKGVQAIDFARQITMDLPFPQPEQPNNAVISQITATTLLDAGNSQFSIVSGGVGQKNVNLRIVSNLAHKVTYNIVIYGK